MGQQYTLFAEGEWLFYLWHGDCASVRGYSMCGGEKAAVGFWQRKGKSQTVNKASQQNVTDPPVPHLCLRLSHPPLDAELWSLSFNLAPSDSHNVAPRGGRQEQQPRPGPQRADNLSALL